MDYNINLINGGIIELKPINQAFLCTQAYNNWIHNIEVNEYSSLCRFPIMERDKKQLLEDMENGKSIHWSIIYKRQLDARGFFIGTVSLQEIDIFNRSAELAIKIGDKEYWGKGIGYASCKEVINHGFDRLNLHRIWLGTVSGNEGMKKLADKLGMFYEGTLNQAFHSKNKFYNVERYATLYTLKDMNTSTIL